MVMFCVDSILFLLITDIDHSLLVPLKHPGIAPGKNGWFIARLDLQGEHFVNPFIDGKVK